MISYNHIDICSRSFDEFTIVYNLRSRVLLKLENVAADIWHFIIKNNNCCVDEIVNYISNEYDCDAQEIEQDILSFLEDMYTSTIILRDNSYYVPEISSSHFSFDDIEDRILYDIEKINQLYSATFELTYACNEKCVHCYANCPGSERHKPNIQLNKYCQIIDELRSMNCFHISFTGGDPFLNSNFLEIYKYARYRGFLCDIYTNGLYLADHDDALSAICKLQPRAFFISLYGAKASTHDYITQTPGSFEKTVRTIKNIRENNIPVVLNIMILSINYEELSDIIEFAKFLNVEYRVNMSLIYTNSGSSIPMDYFVGDTNKIINVLQSVKNHAYSIDKPLGPKTQSNYFCGAGITSISISPDGFVYPCISLKKQLGNVHESSIHAIWNSNVRKTFKNDFTWENAKSCVHCDYSESCPHCVGMSMAENGDMYSCNRCDFTIAKCIYKMNQMNDLGKSIL